MLVTAESVTGGLVSSKIVSEPGASKVFWGGFVTYAEDAKINTLGVPEDVINEFSAVSSQVAKLMSEGAIKKSGADYSLAVTGYAGPRGDNDRHPVGTVYISVSGTGMKTEVNKYEFSGDREGIRNKAVDEALKQLTSYILS